MRFVKAWVGSCRNPKMPHLVLQFQLCLHVRQAEVETTLLSGNQPVSSSSSSSPAVSLSNQAQVRKGRSSSILSKASIELERRVQKHWSIVDKEPITVDTTTSTTRWRVEQAYLTRSRNDAPAGQEVVRPYVDGGVEEEDARVGVEGLPLPPLSFLEEPSLDDDGQRVVGSSSSSSSKSLALVHVERERLAAARLLLTDPLTQEPPSWHPSGTDGTNRGVGGGGGEGFENREKQKLRGYLEGFSSLQSEVATSFSSYRNSKWLQKLEEKIMFLEGMGIDASRVIARYPLFGNCSMQNLQSVIEYLLEDCGLHRKQLVRVVTHNPQLLAHSVKKTVEPAVLFLLDEIRLQKKDLGKVINRCPRLLMSSVDGQLRPTMLYLQSLGFTNMPTLVSNNATLLTFGIHTKLIPKIEFLQSIGLSADESIQALIRFPAIFNYSIDSNLQVKCRYLLDVMGRGLDDVKAFPQYFGYSLEYRIQPRHQFLEKCGTRLSLPNMLKPTDEAFYKRFQDGQHVPTQAAAAMKEVVPRCT